MAELLNKTLTSTIQIKLQGRPCWLYSGNKNAPEEPRRSKAFLHSIATRSYVVEPSPLKGGHPGGQVSRTFAIVENEHGYLVEVELERVQLLDTAEQLEENAAAWGLDELPEERAGGGLNCATCKWGDRAHCRVCDSCICYNRWEAREV